MQSQLGVNQSTALFGIIICYTLHIDAAAEDFSARVRQLLQRVRVVVLDPEIIGTHAPAEKYWLLRCSIQHFFFLNFIL